MISFPIILLRLGVALLLGASVGFERESHEHAAGMRTNALVALGSCLFTIISAFGFMDLLGIAHITLDPTRIASYVVAGIGFLGAGSIFFSRDQGKVAGLTTAAAVWLVAAIGMACGAGLLLEAATATILGLLVLVVLRFVERLLLPKQFSMTQHLHIEATSIGGQFIGQVHDTLARSGINVETLDLGAEQEVETVKVACRIPDAAALVRALGELRALPGVRAVHANLQGISTEFATAKGEKEG